MISKPHSVMLWRQSAPSVQRLRNAPGALAVTLLSLKLHRREVIGKGDGEEDLVAESPFQLNWKDDEEVKRLRTERDRLLSRVDQCVVVRIALLAHGSLQA